MLIYRPEKRRNLFTKNLKIRHNMVRGFEEKIEETGGVDREERAKGGERVC